MFVLLYGQPTRVIVRLRTQDVEEDDGQHFIRFGRTRAPLPQPFADLISESLPGRFAQTMSGGPNDWLFPGAWPDAT